MSQTSPKFADQTDTSFCVTSHRDVKPASISDRVCDYINVRAANLQPKLIYRSQQVKHQGIPCDWRKIVSFRAKAVALAIAITTLPVLANRTSAYDLASGAITEQSSQAKQAVTNQPAEIASNSQRRLALTLAIQTMVAVLLLIGLLAAFLANRAMRPILTAAAKAEKSDEKEPDLFTQLPTKLGYTPEHVSLVQHQEDEAEQSQLLAEITLRLGEATYLEELFRTTVKEVRRAIKTDRVIIFGFDTTNWDGTVVAESVAPGWPQLLRVKIDDPCFRERHIELYKNGQVTSINDIYQNPRVTDCYRKRLEQFAVRANIVAPILKNNQLIALMIGHQCSEPRNWQKADVELFRQLAVQVGFAIDQVNFLEQQEVEAERAQLFTEISSRIRQCVYLEDVLKTTVKEVRRAIKTDRVIIFGLDPTNWDGIVVAESVAPSWPQTLRVRIDDPCLKSKYVEMYMKGRVRAINNIYQEPGLTNCYIKTVEQFAVKAQLVAPIVKNNELLGLMIAHQCSEPRNWLKPEIDLFAQLATQVGFAVHQVSLLQQMEQ